MIQDEPPSSSKEEDKAAQILRLLDNFFSDHNIEHLRRTLGITQNNTWIPVEAMLQFQSLASIEPDAKKIIDIVRKQQLPGNVEAHESELQIRRNSAQPRPKGRAARVRKEMRRRTVCVTGVPRNTGFDRVLEFFEAFKGITNLWMGDHYEEESGLFAFDGSVFVTFNDMNCLEKFVELEKLELDGVELKRVWLHDREDGLPRGASMVLEGSAFRLKQRCVYFS